LQDEEKTPMKKYSQLALLAFLAAGVASLPALARAGQYSQPQQQSNQQQSNQQSNAKAAPPVKLNPAEEKAYKAFYQTPASPPQPVVDSGEAFLKKFPTSRYAGSVYARLATAYEALGDTPKMFDAAHKALQINPDNVDVLSMMAYAIPRRINPNDLDSGAELQEASQDATHALDLLSKMQKPADLTPDQFTAAINAEAASCHSGLGLVDYYQHNNPGMVTELEQAVKLNPNPDASDEFLLGLAYMQAGRPADAETVLGKCNTQGGPLADRCKSALEQAQKQAASQTNQ
jgi:tetratricopeptide (TPR) repeat protein